MEKAEQLSYDLTQAETYLENVVCEGIMGIHPAELDDDPIILNIQPREHVLWSISEYMHYKGRIAYLKMQMATSHNEMEEHHNKYIEFDTWKELIEEYKKAITTGKEKEFLKTDDNLDQITRIKAEVAKDIQRIAMSNLEKAFKQD